nr:type II 3-dehydroquinate dehydratase [Campylobacter sp.]
MKIRVIQGPNINMLGKREPEIYGLMSMEEIHENMRKVAEQANIEIEFFQSNYEGEIIDKIQECVGTCDAIIINPAGFSHTSVALRDAISAVKLPCVEVHVTNIYKREEFRQKSLTAGACIGIISGFGPLGYHLALISLLQILEQIKASQNA